MSKFSWPLYWAEEFLCLWFYQTIVFALRFLPMTSSENFEPKISRNPSHRMCNCVYSKYTKAYLLYFLAYVLQVSLLFLSGEPYACCLDEEGRLEMKPPGGEPKKKGRYIAWMIYV